MQEMEGMFGSNSSDSLISWSVLKTIGTPFLFRSITVRSRAAFEKLRDRLLTDVASRDDHPGKSTRTLRIMFEGDDRTYMGCTMIALTSMVQLQTVVFQRSILPSELYMLASSCGESLQTLQINLDNTPVFPIDKYCRFLENFKKLKSLDITVTTNQRVQSHYGPSSIMMPTLHTIRYTSRGQWHQLGLKALCHMHLPALRELHMDLPNMGMCELQLFLLFQNNTHLAKLSVILPQASSKRFMAFPIQASTAVFSFVPTIFPAEMTCRVERIVFCADLDQLSDASRFLGEVTTQVVDAMRLKQIQVTLSEHFSWSGAGPSSSVEYSAFVGAMVHWSLRLKNQGVDLLDQNGRAIDLRADS